MNEDSQHAKLQQQPSAFETLQGSPSAHQKLQDGKGFQETGFMRVAREQKERAAALRAAGARWAQDGLGLKGAAAEKAARDFSRKPERVQRQIIGTLDMQEQRSRDYQSAIQDAVAAAAGGTPFRLIPYLDGATQKVKVLYSTLAGEAPTTPTPEADLSYLFTPSGTQKVYGKVTINGTTGEVTARILAAGASVPEDDDTNFHVEIGTMTANGSDPAAVANARYGPIDVTICRNWFAAEAPFFGVSFSGS